MSEEKHYIAMLISPGMGHLIPLAELAKVLVSRHGFTVTLFIPTIASQPLEAITNFLKTLPNDIDYILLPPVNFDNLPSGDTKPEARICLTVTRSLGSIRDSLGSLASRAKRVALVTDCFSLDAFEVAKEVNVPFYLYIPTAAMNLHFMLYLPTLHEEVKCEFRDMPDPIRLPGCVPLHGRDFVDPTQDRASEGYKWILHHSKRTCLADGILLNSFMELEPGPIEALLREEPGRPPVYPVGPIIQSGSSDEPGGSTECLRWLDGQPNGSVLFVSFGSGGTLTNEQIQELAYGLEMSGERFLWVVRSPDETSSSGSYFSAQTREDPFGFLLNGFVDRTRDRGLLVPSWAPQIKVLSHPSTGGFLTHCGWNSTLESITHGVPLIAWPLYAEQKTNAVMLTEGIKVAIRPKANQKGLIERDEISRVIKNLMREDEGKTIRLKAKELKEAAKATLDENGASTKMLKEVALKWRSKARA